MTKYLFVFLILLAATSLIAQSPAQLLIDKSIKYHDPHDRWSKWKADLSFTVLFPPKPDAKRFVSIDNKKDEFSFRAVYAEGDLVYKLNKGVAEVLWNDQDQLPADMVEKHRISKDRAVMYRDYFSYLYGMPMKLNDQGTIVHPDVQQVEFYGNQYHKVKVTYEENVGGDTWYFYFDIKTNALKAYQFFKDESKNDGEYILFEGEITKGKIRIPKDRKWYYNKDEKYLATDVLHE